MVLVLFQRRELSVTLFTTEQCHVRKASAVSAPLARDRRRNRVVVKAISLIFFCGLVFLCGTRSFGSASPDVFAAGFGEAVVNTGYSNVGSTSGHPVYAMLDGWGSVWCMFFTADLGGGYVICNVSPNNYLGFGDSVEYYNAPASDPWSGVWQANNGPSPGGVMYAGLSVPVGWTNAVVMVGNNSQLTAEWWKGFELGALLALAGLMVRLLRHLARPGVDI